MAMCWSQRLHSAHYGNLRPALVLGPYKEPMTMPSMVQETGGEVYHVFQLNHLHQVNPIHVPGCSRVTCPGGIPSGMLGFHKNEAHGWVVRYAACVVPIFSHLHSPRVLLLSSTYAE